ncbi:hypothetical protein JW926_18780, partial [Candidatus Sumerlaeota bacterium]|nr:hypothetical protein [Candidatus Sumerlaeota bacterium]
MGTHGRDYYEKWSSMPLHFNPADIESLPLQEATARAATKFREEWKRHKEQALKITREYNKFLKGEDSDEIKTVSLDEELKELRSLIQSFKELIERDDYEIDTLVAGLNPKGMSGIPTPDFLQFQTSMMILGLKSHQLMNDGKTSEALNMAETMI